MTKEGTERKKEYLLLLLSGCILGAACFLLVYGYRIINPLYDDWLFLGDMDLRQHYIGFCHFRQSRWQFPVGLIETLSYPNSMSVIYTDSIPLFAVFFKLFSGLLPVRFQYFGLFGLISFMLMGGLSVLLLRRFTDNRYVCITGSVFFILAYPVIQRLYYHTALSAQWIIILCLDLWLYQEEMGRKKRVAFWSLMGFLCVAVHSYFLPMAGLIMLCAIADLIISEKYAGEVMPGGKSRHHKTEPALKEGLLRIFGFCMTALFNLFILGGFYGGTDASGPGLGTFNSNLNTFINPLDDGRIYRSLPLYNGFQYEGFGYLGFGIICLLAASSVLYVILKYVRSSRADDIPLPDTSDRKDTASEEDNSSEQDAVSRQDINIQQDTVLQQDTGPGQEKSGQSIFAHAYRIRIAAAMFAVSAAMAVLPMVTVNDKKLFGVPYPEFVHRILSIFRSNGRFIWPCVYLLMLAAVMIPVKLLRDKTGLSVLIVIAGLMLQLYDISYMLSYKHEQFSAEKTYDNIWLSDTHIDDIDGFSGFVFLYNDNDIIMDTAFYAYLNGMWLNNYYYARDINEIVDKDINEWRHELNNGMVRDDVIYIVKNEGTDPDILSGMQVSADIEGHVYGYKKCE